MNTCHARARMYNVCEDRCYVLRRRNGVVSLGKMKLISIQCASHVIFLS